MPSSADDALSEVLARTADEVVDRVRASAVMPATVIIDGRSGSGKSTLADLIVAAWPRPNGVELVRMDSIYPGWDGLERASVAVTDGLLLPRAAHRTGHVWEWDWERGRPAVRREVGTHRDLLIEGCGALTARAGSLADVSVWVDGDERMRRQRAFERDGDGFRPYWDRWAMQEAAHIARHAPDRRADLAVSVS